MREANERHRKPHSKQAGFLQTEGPNATRVKSSGKGGKAQIHSIGGIGGSPGKVPDAEMTAAPKNEGNACGRDI